MYDGISRVFQLDFHLAPCDFLENLLVRVMGPVSWHTQLILVRTCGGRDGGVHAARARGAERGAALAQVDLHGSGRVAAPEAAAVVVHAAARAAHLGARGLGGGQVRERCGVRVAVAVLPRHLAPRGGSGTCVDKRCRVSSTTTRELGLWLCHGVRSAFCLSIHACPRRVVRPRAVATSCNHYG